MDPFAVFEDSHDGHHGHGGHSGHQSHEDRGTMTELWQIGVARHPDIVAKHGEFSEELFRAMLGMPVDVIRDPMEPKVEEESDFAYPHAHLVLDMRSGQRKLLPIVDRWGVSVDIAMTAKEIVYFEHIDADSENTVHEGKEASSVDVAAGRSVVGMLELCDIESVRVVREEVKDSPNQEIDDILTIRTVDGCTLCLRFFNVSPDAKNVDFFANDKKDDAPSLQWAETVVRFCSAAQLKQPLPDNPENDREALHHALIVNKHHHEGRRESISFSNLSEFLK